MKTLQSDGLQYKDGQLLILDQTRLPNEEIWLNCQSLEEMYQAIFQLCVRGAPLIGVAASMFIGKYAMEQQSKEKLMHAIDYLISSRPTAVNLQLLLDQHRDILTQSDSFNAHLELAIKHFEEDVTLCENMATHGAGIIRDGDTILTHCNAGSLATVGIGTAVGVIKKAAQTKKDIHVFVDETRPLLQGARLTTWELNRANVPYQLICDNMAAFLMQQRKVDVILVGADRICRNGDFANKIGTYGLAVLAKHHDVPFYAVAPYTTIDFECEQGSEIPIEQRAAEEVRGIKFKGEPLCWSMQNAEVYNPAFDVTPAELVTGYILDTGINTASQLSQLKLDKN